MKQLLLVTIIVFVIFSCKKDSTSSGPSLVPNAANFLTTGKSATDFLSDAAYNSLSIEIQYAPGMRPQDQSVTNLLWFLNATLNKPGGITVTFSQAASTDSANITLQTAANIEMKRRTQYNNGNTLTVYIFFADAGYTKQANVVGVAYRNTSMIVYEKTILAQTATINKRIQVESAVLEHEFGHLLGLVNVGTPMVVAHEDAANKGHCNNSNCLMYFQLGSSIGLMNMSGIPVLDINCMNDLKANGGK